MSRVVARFGPGEDGNFLGGNATWKISILNPKMEVSKMIFLVSWVIFGFHLNFQGCDWMQMDANQERESFPLPSCK